MLRNKAPQKTKSGGEKKKEMWHARDWVSGKDARGEGGGKRLNLKYAIGNCYCVEKESKKKGSTQIIS